MQSRCLNCMKEFESEYEVCPHCGHVVGEKPKEAFLLIPGVKLSNRYVVGNAIGYGGFGITYIGWDSLLEQTVAIKEFFPKDILVREENRAKLISEEYKAQYEDGLSNFVEEAKSLSKLKNVDSVVKILDSFNENDTAYIVMEYLEGESLKVYLERNGKLSAETAISLIKPILVALSEIHSMDIIHRDVSPDNIFITKDGRIKLIDFGSSRYEAIKNTENISVALKVGYSPEEQYRSKGVQGSWTDVYSVAATLYKMLTGVTPPDARDRLKRDTLVKPSKLGVRIPANVEASLMNALNVTAENRTQTAKDFIKELESEEVKLIKEKQQKIDIGKWPLWVKIVSIAGIALIVIFGVLLATGVFHKAMDYITGNALEAGYTRVPNILNMSAGEAETECTENKVILQIYDKAFTDEVEPDRIMSQLIEGGSVVEENTAVFASVSAGKEKILVQDYEGYNGDAVKEVLDDCGIKYSISTEQSGVMPGCITAQSVEPGEICDVEGLEIAITISEGQTYEEGYTEVPDFSNMEFGFASEKASESSLYIVKTSVEKSDTVPEGCVISQYPEAGTVVQNGGTVEVVVSGEDIQLVPDVQYKDAGEVLPYLQSLGYVVKTEYEDNDIVYKDHIVSQSITANSIVETGAEITLVISNGNPQVAEPDEELSKQLESGTVISNATDSKMSVIQAASVGEYLVYVPQTYADANGLVFTTNLDEITIPYYLIEYDAPETSFEPGEYEIKLRSISKSEPDVDGYITIVIDQYTSFFVDDGIGDDLDSIVFFDYYSGTALFGEYLYIDCPQYMDDIGPRLSTELTYGDKTCTIYCSIDILWDIEWGDNPFPADVIEYEIRIPEDYDGLCLAVNTAGVTQNHSFVDYSIQLQILDLSIWQEDISVTDLMCVRINDYIAEYSDSIAVIETEAVPQVTDPIAQETESVLSEENVCSAICNWLDSTGYDWDLAEQYYGWGPDTYSQNGVYVTDMRSYTGALLRYYTDPSSGYTYVVTWDGSDEEYPTGEEFNVFDYIY